MQIIPRLRAAIAEVARLEGAAESARKGSLLGRMSGMVQGAAAQAQAAAGLQRDGLAPGADAFGEEEAAQDNGHDSEHSGMRVSGSIAAAAPTPQQSQSQPHSQQRQRAHSLAQPSQAHRPHAAAHQQRHSHALPVPQGHGDVLAQVPQQTRQHGGLPQMRQSATSMFQGLMSRGASAMRNAGL